MNGNWIKLSLKMWYVRMVMCVTQRQPRMCSHLEGCWKPFHMCGSYQSPFFQSNQWCFSCFSVENKWHNFILQRLWKLFIMFYGNSVCLPLTSTVLTSSIECISFTGSTCCWRMKSAMAATDLWPLYSLFIIIPLRNNFNVGYLVIRYRWAMSATPRQSRS